MIVTCPSCDAQYLLPDEAVGANGRRVKCTTCSYVWVQRPEEEEDSIQISFIDAPDGPSQSDIGPRHGMTPVKKEAGTARVVLAGLSLALLLIALTLGYATVIRSSVIAAWPPSALLFETLGVPAHAPGASLDISELDTSFNTVDGDNILKVSGIIKNTSQKDEHLPALQVRLYGKDGPLKDWRVALYGKTIPAGQEAKFEYGFVDAPHGGHNVSVRFVD